MTDVATATESNANSAAALLEHLSQNDMGRAEGRSAQQRMDDAYAALDTPDEAPAGASDTKADKARQRASDGRFVAGGDGGADEKDTPARAAPDKKKDDEPAGDGKEESEEDAKDDAGKEPKSARERMVHGLLRRARKEARAELAQDQARLAQERADAERFIGTKADELRTQAARYQGYVATEEARARGDHYGAAVALGLDVGKIIEGSLRAEGAVGAHSPKRDDHEVTSLRARLEAIERATAEREAASAAVETQRAFTSLVRGDEDAFPFSSAVDDAQLIAYGDQVANSLAHRAAGMSRTEFFRLVARELESQLAATYERLSKRKGAAQSPSSDRGTEPGTPANLEAPRARRPVPLDHRLSAESSGTGRKMTMAQRMAEAEKLV